jgi:hypothetical protein
MSNLYGDFTFGEDFDKQMFELIKMNRDFHKKIKENYDNRTKTIGDKVIVWDLSRLTDFETNEVIKSMSNEDMDLLCQNESIVIEDNIEFISKLDTMFGVFEQNLDIVVWNKKLNKKFRTSSEYVKLID